MATRARGSAGSRNLPLMFQPGSRWHYGIATDVLGVLIERVSGMSLGDFFRTRIFEPLGMRDTAFWVPEAQLSQAGHRV